MTALFRQALSFAIVDTSAAANSVYGITVTVNGTPYTVQATNTTGTTASSTAVRDTLVALLNEYAFPVDDFRLRALPVGAGDPGLIIVIDYDAEKISSLSIAKSAQSFTYLYVNGETLLHTSLEAGRYTSLLLEHQAYVAAHPDSSAASELVTATAEVVAAATALAGAASSMQEGASALVEALRAPLGGQAPSDPTVGVTLASLAGFLMGKASGEQTGDRPQPSVQAALPRTNDGVSF